MNWNSITRDWRIITGEVIAHYSSLGVFIPIRAQRHVPYARRVEYAGSGRHHVKVTRRPMAWVRSRLRDAGDVIAGAFLSPQAAD